MNKNSDVIAHMKQTAHFLRESAKIPNGDIRAVSVANRNMANVIESWIKGLSQTDSRTPTVTR